VTYFGIDVLEGYFSNCRALYLTNIFFKPWAPPLNALQVSDFL